MLKYNSLHSNVENIIVKRIFLVILIIADRLALVIVVVLVTEVELAVYIIVVEK